jgi:hypothetical protein
LNRQNPTEKVINLLKSATPDELNSDQLGERLQELVTVGVGNGNGNGVIKQAIRYGLSSSSIAPKMPLVILSKRHDV